ncbi:hypothetical protein FOA52_014696 [Chlamydomonas sp. UWO 241]|nr:hypothetical protein FOA52_014696 [Chlamydomonas sp. UWO 241]
MPLQFKAETFEVLTKAELAPIQHKGGLPELSRCDLPGPDCRATVVVMAGQIRELLEVTLAAVKALGPVARITGRVQTAELWGAEAPLWANPLLQLELPAAQRSVQWREPTGDAAGHALFSPTDAARWLVDGLARVRDALPGMRTVTDLCVLWAWLAAVDMVFAGLRGLEAAVPTLWRMPLLNARKEPIWRLWLRDELARLGIDGRDCVEKRELVDLVVRHQEQSVPATGAPSAQGGGHAAAAGRAPGAEEPGSSGRAEPSAPHHASMDSALCDKCFKRRSDGHKLFGCSGCKAVYYCSKECQNKSWRDGHKRDCKQAQAVGGSGV